MRKDIILAALRSVKTGVVRKQAAKILGISERTLQKNMNKFDISLRDWRPEKKKPPKRKGWGACKLSMDIAKDIRKQFRKGKEIKDMAEKYNVTFSSISRIIRNETYKEYKVKFSGTANVNVEYKPLMKK